MKQEESKETELPKETEAPKETEETLEQVKRSRPVKVYLTVLFIAVLLLLVMSFFMQQRSHQALEDITDSMSERQTLVELQLKNQDLTFQAQNLKKEVDGLKEAATTHENQAKALEWLRQIEAASEVSLEEAKRLVEAFKETGLEKSLPTESVVEGATSPAEDYRNLYATLF